MYNYFAILIGMQLFYAGEPLYVAVVFGTKVSLVLLYLRIWSKDSRNLNMACWIVIGLLTALFISFEFATIFQCIPISYNWRSLIDRTAKGSCTDRQAQIYSQAAFNIFFDVLVLLLPVPSLLKLNISWMKKLGVGIVFAVGIVVTICSIVRLTYLSKYSDSTNVTWNYTYIGLWSLLEVHLSVVCVCVPAAAGLFYRTWRHVHSGSPAESLDDLDNRGNTGDEKQMLGGNADGSQPRTLATTAQVSGLGLSNMDLESGKSTNSDEEASTSPPGFDEMWTNLGDKNKQQPAHELHGDSKEDHETSTERPALHTKRQSSASRVSSKNRPALPSQSQSNDSHVLGKDQPIMLSASESKERQERYRTFQTQNDPRESQSRPPMQSPGTSRDSTEGPTPLSRSHSQYSQQRPGMHSRGASRDSQGRPSPLSPNQYKEAVQGTARPSFHEQRWSEEFHQSNDQRPGLQSSQQSQWGQSNDGDRPGLYAFGQSKDGQSLYSNRPGLFPPQSRDGQSYYSDRPTLHSSYSNDGNRPGMSSRGQSREGYIVNMGRPALFSQGPSQANNWQSSMSSRGQSRDGSTARPALFSQYQSKEDQSRPPLPSSGQSKDMDITDAARPGLYSNDESQSELNIEEVQAKVAAAEALIGVSALEQQGRPPLPAKSPSRNSYTRSSEEDKNAELAATIADALVGVRAMQAQLAKKESGELEHEQDPEPKPEPNSPSKSSQDTRNDSATETTEKPLASPYSFNGRSKSYRNQPNEASPAATPLSPPFSPPLASPNTMAGRDHPLRSQGRQPSFEGEQLRQRAATIETEARERSLEETQSPRTPKTPKSARFETRASLEEQRRVDVTEVAAPEAVTAAATVAASATVPAAATAALGEKRELARRSRSESQLRDEDEERRRADAWQPVTPTYSRSASYEDHPLNAQPPHNPYVDQQLRKGAGTQTDFPYESEENFTSPEPPEEARMSPELKHYKKQRAAESEAALVDAYQEHMERRNPQVEPPRNYEEEYWATKRAERAADRASRAAKRASGSFYNEDIGGMLSAMATAVGEVGDQPADEERNREGMEEVAGPEAFNDENPLKGLRTSDPIETEFEAQQATELAIADAAPPPTIHRSRSNSQTSRPDPSPIQRRSRPTVEDHKVYELDGSAPPPTIHRSRSSSQPKSRPNSNPFKKTRRQTEDSGAESAIENDHPLRSQGKSGLYSRPNSRPTSFMHRRGTNQSDSAAESATEDDHPLRSQGQSGLYSNRLDSTESLDAAQQRNASVVAIKAAAEQRRARQKRRTSGNSIQSAKSDSSTEILYEGRAKREKTYKSFVAEPAKPIGRGAYPGRGRGMEQSGGGGYTPVGRSPAYRDPSSEEEWRVRVTERPGSDGSRELRMPWREWNGEDDGW